MKKTPTSVPHDGLFKTFLTDPAVARDFLAIHLPPALLQICDLNTLQLTSGSFIEEDLRTWFADVLYSLKTINGEGYIYALIEHQSSPDRHMAFRLMRYCIAAMQRHLDAGHDRLPLVMPILFCHGRATPWPHTLNWLELFDDPGVAHQLYSQSFPAVDPGTLADDDIMKHRRVAVLELLLKHIRIRELAEIKESLISLLSQGYSTETQRMALLNWMVQTGNAAEPTALLEELAHRLPQYKEEFMTIAQKLEQIGREQGLKQGRLQGELETTRKIAHTMLQNNMDDVTVIKMTGISEDELNQIRHNVP